MISVINLLLKPLCHTGSRLLLLVDEDGWIAFTHLDKRSAIAAVTRAMTTKWW